MSLFPKISTGLTLAPDLTLKTWHLGYSFRDSGIPDRYSLDLVKAGLPER